MEWKKQCKKQWKKTINLSIIRNINSIENSFSFKINTGTYLEFQKQWNYFEVLKLR